MMPSWRRSADAAANLRARQAGADLLKHLTLLYAEKKLTAVDFSLACHYCTEAGVRGADFEQFAVPPGQSTGNYQKTVDRALPAFDPLYRMEVPMMERGTMHRQVREIPLNPLHEAVAREVRADPSLLERVSTTPWPDSYMSHPAVVRARSEGTQWPLPLALYLDGVRFTAPLVGRSDSILGIWGYNCLTGKRHYLMSLRARDACDCGCRSWCTLYPMMLALSWSLRALDLGRRPAARHDGSPWAEHDPIRRLADEHGEDLPKAVLLWLKGDWAEVHHSLGMPSVVSTHCPCPFCTLRQDELHSQYDTMALPLRQDEYSDICNQREIVIRVESEAVRSQICTALSYRRGQLGFGRELDAELQIGAQRLFRGDRFEPTPELPDVALVDTAPLPLVVKFWRNRRDFRSRNCDPVIRRNPIFDVCEPLRVLAIDSLHTVYSGVAGRYVSAIVWRLLLANAWGVRGDQSTILEIGIRRASAHMARWFETQNIPANRRLSMLTLGMIGDRRDCAISGDPHPGSPTKFKAAETGTILPWSVSLLESLGSGLAHFRDLLTAGKALVRWLEITREAEVIMTPAQTQELNDCCQRHLVNIQRAGVHCVPKHHFFAHLSANAGTIGCPKAYSCFLDESLNLCLRNIAEGCHRARQEERIFTHFNLLGNMGWSDHLYGE